MSIFGNSKPDGDVGLNTQPTQPQVDPAADKDPIVGSIERELSEKVDGAPIAGVKRGAEPTAKQPVPLDFSNLTPDQINALREMFEKTPRRKTVEEKYNTVEMRSIGGRIVIGWSRAFLGLVDNPVENRKDMRQMIKVQFAGSKEETTMLYRDFMQAERVVCRIVDTKTQTNPQEVGTTYKRDEDGGLTSQQVVMYVNHVQTTFTIQLPDGSTAEVDAERVN